MKSRRYVHQHSPEEYGVRVRIEGMRLHRQGSHFEGTEKTGRKERSEFVSFLLRDHIPVVLRATKTTWPLTTRNLKLIEVYRIGADNIELLETRVWSPAPIYIDLLLNNKARKRWMEKFLDKKSVKMVLAQKLDEWGFEGLARLRRRD